MKIAIILSILSAFSGNLLAAEITGEEAAQKFKSLKGSYESSANVVVAGMEVRLTIRHDNVISCEKEETLYSNSEVAEVEYRCNSIE